MIARVTGQPDLASLSVDQMADILKATGVGEITVAMILEDVEAGAPTNPDGTLNFLTYVAWLTGEVVGGA